MFFRSPQHQMWFIISIITIFWCGFAYWKNCYTILFGAIGFHAGAWLSAIIATRFGTVNGNVYSIDCLWFNPLMCLMHIALFYVLKLW